MALLAPSHFQTGRQESNDRPLHGTPRHGKTGKGGYHYRQHNAARTTSPRSRAPLQTQFTGPHSQKQPATKSRE